MILIYTFYVWNNASYKIVRSLDDNPNIKKMYILGLKGAMNLASHIKKHNYDYIIGLGDFTKTAKKMRVEEKFINKYGKSKIFEDGKEIYSKTLEFSLSENMYSFDKPTTSSCNQSAYIALNIIEKENLKSKLAFIHIPGRMDLALGKKELENIISQLH